MKNINIAAVFLALLIAYFVILVWSDLNQYDQHKRQLKKNREMMQVEKEKEARLQKSLSGFKKSDEIELFAREKLLMIKSGEKGYKIIKK